MYVYIYGLNKALVRYVTKAGENRQVVLFHHCVCRAATRCAAARRSRVLQLTRRETESCNYRRQAEVHAECQIPVGGNAWQKIHKMQAEVQTDRDAQVDRRGRRREFENVNTTASAVSRTAAGTLPLRAG